MFVDRQLVRLVSPFNVAMLLRSVRLLVLLTSAGARAPCPAYNDVPCNGLGSCGDSGACSCSAGFGGASCEVKKTQPCCALVIPSRVLKRDRDYAAPETSCVEQLLYQESSIQKRAALNNFSIKKVAYSKVASHPALTHHQG